MAFFVERGRSVLSRIRERIARRFVGVVWRLPLRWREPVASWIRRELTPQLRHTFRRRIVFRKTEWIRDRVVGPIDEVIPGSNQWITVDVSVIGPDGQLINLPIEMYGKKKWNESEFRRRLASELKRLEEEDKIGEIGEPTLYVRRAILVTDFYITTTRVI